MQNDLETSELMPHEDTSFMGLEAIRTPQFDSSTCIAYEAYDTKQGGRHIFIKQLRPELTGNQRQRDCFIKEYNIGKQLYSNYFPHYIDLNNDGATLSIAMSYVEGETLAERISTNPEYFRNKSNLMRFIYQMLEALEDLHNTGVLHLDLKPENILLTRRSDNVCIIDLGYSCSDEWANTSGRTLAFASPEQQQGNEEAICSASDLYTFGQIMLHIAKQCNVRLPKGLLAIFNKCTQKDISDRYSSAREVTDAIESFTQKRTTHHWKAVVAMLTLIIMGIGCHAFYNTWKASSFCVDGFQYRILSVDSMTVTLEGIDSVSARYDSTFVLPSTVSRLGRTFAVTAVADSAFTGSKWIKHLIIPQSIERLGHYAFERCSALEQINLPTSITVIPQGCFVNAKITHINLHEGITEIGRDAFGICHNLQEVTLPRSLKELGRGAFWECKALEKVEIKSDMKDIGQYSFWFCDNLKTFIIHSHEIINFSTPDELFTSFDFDLYVQPELIESYKVEKNGFVFFHPKAIEE